jgi:hypothetical protein
MPIGEALGTISCKSNSRMAHVVCCICSRLELAPARRSTVAHRAEMSPSAILRWSYNLRPRRANVLATDKAIEGFNIGMNCGITAGETIMHCHVHLIPRRPGDVDQPRGGLRAVVSGRAAY